MGRRGEENKRERGGEESRREKGGERGGTG